MHRQEIEVVARALYEIREDARQWDREPEWLKMKYRNEARAAIAILDDHSACH
jgi:hypothetical protein